MNIRARNCRQFGCGKVCCLHTRYKFYRLVGYILDIAHKHLICISSKTALNIVLWRVVAQLKDAVQQSAFWIMVVPILQRNNINLYQIINHYMIWRQKPTVISPFIQGHWVLGVVVVPFLQFKIPFSPICLFYHIRNRCNLVTNNIYPIKELSFFTSTIGVS